MRRGFSLLEVMVAVAILGLTLTVILSAQGGLAASNRSASNMGQAVQLARCKMTELEEDLLRLGFQEMDQLETSVSCCADATTDTFTCDTKVERVELPNMNTGNSLDEDGSLIGASSSLLGPNNVAGGPGLDLNVDAGLQGLGAQLTDQFGGGAGAEGLMGMVMGMIYPSIKPMYEASIRRVSVTVRWREGRKPRELPITQYLTQPQRGGFAGDALLPDGGVMDFGAPGSGPADPMGGPGRSMGGPGGAMGGPRAPMGGGASPGAPFGGGRR